MYEDTLSCYRALFNIAKISIFEGFITRYFSKQFTAIMTAPPPFNVDAGKLKHNPKNRTKLIRGGRQDLHMKTSKITGPAESVWLVGWFTILLQFYLNVFKIKIVFCQTTS